jgi:hypothetical protein
MMSVGLRKNGWLKFLGVLFPAILLLVSFNNCSQFEVLSSGRDNRFEENTAPGVLPSFTLTSPTSQAAAPFTLGQGFKKGDVPTGTEIEVTGADAQVTVKNRYPDGSVKFVVIAGRANLSANVPTMVSLSRGKSLSGAVLTVQDMKATNVTASVAAEGFGAVTWSGADWDTPFQNWVSGPRMSSFVDRKWLHQRSKSYR